MESTSPFKEIVKTPRLVIQYCTKCKWTNRAIWYTQEVLQTFTNPQDIAEISLQPEIEKPGTFAIYLQVGEYVEVVYRRKFKKVENRGDNVEDPDEYDGFPDAKFLKSLIKEKLLKLKAKAENGEKVLSSVQLGDHLSSGKGNLLNDGGREETQVECRDCIAEEGGL